MGDFSVYFSERLTLRLVVLSFVVLLIYFLIRKLIMRKIIKNQNIEKFAKLELINSFKTYLNVIFAVTLVTVWFSQIQPIFVSLVAVAAAIVIALKELIMSVMGGVLINMNGHYKVGDRIQIGDVRGFVIEKNMTTTRVLEIGFEKNSQQTTGNIIVIPNSIALSTPVRNESYFRNFAIKSFNFKLPKKMKLADFEKNMVNLANEICKDYLETAEDAIEKYCLKENLAIPTIEPRLKVIISEDGEVEVLLKMPVKNQELGDVEQILNRNYVKLIEMDQVQNPTEDS